MDRMMVRVLGWVVGLDSVHGMNEEITVRYRWTAEALVESSRWDLRQRFPRPVRWMFWPLVIVSLSVGARLLIQSPLSTMGTVLFGLGVFVPLALFFIRPWSLRRQFSKRPDRESEIEWRLSSEGLKARGEHSSADLQWSALAKIVRTPAGFLLYPTHQVLHWLPRDGFASDAEFEQVARMVQEKGVSFREVS